MTESALQSPTAAPPARFPGLHVALIMDGNGRWAQSRGKPRAEGHRAGVEAVRRIVAAAPVLGIGTLTLFAFSSDNWDRPQSEARTLFHLLEEFLRAEADNCAERDTRLGIVGRRDRLPPTLRSAAEEAEALTAACNLLDLRIAVDYSGRDAILRAACRFYTSLEISREAFARLIGAVTHGGESSTDVDLIIRTGGEQRLSDFMLWESAYAELLFVPKMWPDFNEEDLASAVVEFQQRERRFGKISERVAS